MDCRDVGVRCIGGAGGVIGSCRATDIRCISEGVNGRALVWCGGVGI